MFHKNLIERKIKELEESNKISREFSRLLNREIEEDKNLDDAEFIQRSRREYAIMVLKDIIEESEEVNKEEE